MMKNIYRIAPQTVIHVGAHNAQSREDYLNLGIRQFHWFEALPELAENLQNRHRNDHVYQGVVWSQSNLLMDFYQMDDTKNSSAIRIQEKSNHKVNSVRKLLSLTLDDALAEKELGENSILVIDIQGAELKALQGAEILLGKIRYVVIEVGITNQGYESVPEAIEITSLLAKFGFKKSIVRVSKNENYYDQLYVKANLFRLYWQLSADFILCELLKIRHLIIFRHSQKFHYHCSICNF